MHVIRHNFILGFSLVSSVWVALGGMSHGNLRDSVSGERFLYLALICGTFVITYKAGCLLSRALINS